MPYLRIKILCIEISHGKPASHAKLTEPFERARFFKSQMISLGGLTARLDRLEAAGFIRRRDADDDARSRIVELTQAGKKKIEAAFRDDMELENRMVEGLTESERTELVRLLRKLTSAMKG